MAWKLLLPVPTTVVSDGEYTVLEDAVGNVQGKDNSGAQESPEFF